VIYLIVSIFFVSLMSVLMRYSLSKGATALALNFSYRGTAALAVLAMLLFKTGPATLRADWDLGWTLIAVASLSYWLTGLASIKSVQLGPLGPSWTILRCSMILPVIASILYWNELSVWPPDGPAAARVSGVVLGLVTVVVCGSGRRASNEGSTERVLRDQWLPWMTAAFLAQGVWEICLRATRGLAAGDERAVFLLVVFAASCLLTVPPLIIRGVRVRAKDLTYGAVLGLCALGGTGCRVLALREVDGTIVFPATTVCAMLLAQLAGRYIWGEKTPRAALGLVLGIASVLLLAIG